MNGFYQGFYDIWIITSQKLLQNLCFLQNSSFLKCAWHSWVVKHYRDTVEYIRHLKVNRFTVLKFLAKSGKTLVLIWSEFKRINSLLFPLKLSENSRFSNDFRGNRSYKTRLNPLNIRSAIWRRSHILSNKYRHEEKQLKGSSRFL